MEETKPIEEVTPVETLVEPTPEVVVPEVVPAE